MKIKEIAHTRAGDKGDGLNIAVIAYDKSGYELLKEKVTEAKVHDFFKDMCKGRVKRYAVDDLLVLNFVLEHALDGGSSRNLGVDPLGRGTALALLEMEI